MNNPYANEQETVDFRIGRSTAYAIIYLFLLLVTLAPLYRNLASNFAPLRALFSPERDQSIVDHLHAAEKEIEDAPFTKPVRQVVQTSLTLGPLREGNTKTHIGRDGWLYFKVALDALTGYGPLLPEPDSVAKDPNRDPWDSPLDAITTFAAQLAETDTQLLLVPIPVKPMIYPEHLGIEADNPLAHPDAAEFYERIAALPNADVLDLAETFWNAKADFQLFLKQDTHWTPDGMELAAGAIAARVTGQPWHIFKHGISELDREDRSSLGDLVEKLDIGDAGFTLESVDPVPVDGPTRDQSSPIVLLGDSFANIYSDAVGLRWGADAGLAEHIALRLSTPLDVIAINGGGATEVRQTLAKRKGAAIAMKDKKLIIWAIATRDLFLSETAAGRAQVEWEEVVFDTRQPEPPNNQADAQPVRVRARLVAKPEIPDPKTTSYTALLYAAEYELVETLSGEAPETEDERFLVLHWAFKDDKLLPSASYAIGAEREMRLVPFESQTKLKTLEQRNDSDLFVDLLWALEPAGETAGSEMAAGSNLPSPLLPASGCALYAALLGLGLLRAARRSGDALSR